LETPKARERLKRFCVGNGVDLGFGGDPIVPQSITIDIAPETKPNLLGDASDLYWFRNSSLDYVYSSHLLEDFEDTKFILKEWLRVIKPGGYLVLFCPDEKIYLKHCTRTGQAYNQDHKITEFGLEYIKNILNNGFFGGQFNIVYETELIDEYSFDLVLKKSL